MSIRQPVTASDPSIKSPLKSMVAENRNIRDEVLTIVAADGGTSRRTSRRPRRHNRYRRLDPQTLTRTQEFADQACCRCQQRQPRAARLAVFPWANRLFGGG